MAGVATIISFVSWGSRLSLSLYRFGASVSSGAHDVNRIAKGVSLFSLTLKQIGATLREDDTVPSTEAFETVQNILDQCQGIFGEIEALVPVIKLHEDAEEGSPTSESIHKWEWTHVSEARMNYLLGHLESLKLTLSVMLQTFYTVKIVRWTRTHPTISPARMADTIQNEKLQTEILVIEQQMSLLASSKLYDELRRIEALSNPHLIKNNEGSNSLMILGNHVEHSASPNSLVPYQETSLKQLSTSYNDPDSFSRVLHVSAAHIDHLLDRWTRLQEIQERMDRHQYEAQAQMTRQQYERRRSQQPTVESDDSDDQLGALPGVKLAGRWFAAPVSQRPSSIQPLFPDSSTLPIAVPVSRVGSAVPISPASSQYGISPRSSGIFANSPGSHSQSPASPRTSISSLPIRAATTVTTKDDDESPELEIPWRLCLKDLYWEYVDGKVERSNTDLPSSTAFTERGGWTEIMASWVCREAIEEAKYPYNPMKRERNEGGRTKLDTAFSISRSLTFAEVERLVERTVEMYRQRRRVRSPKRRFSSSSNQPYPIQPRIPSFADRPSRAIQPPNIDRSNTTLPFLLPPVQTQPPSLDRATSFPGPNPHYQPHTPISPNTSYPASPYFPQYAQQIRNPQAERYRPTFSTSSQRTGTHAHASYSASTTSDSDAPAKPRTRRASSRGNRRKPSPSRRRSRGSSAVGTLAKVGGLAALLDGIVDVAKVF